MAYSYSKLAKHKVMMMSSQLRNALPATQLLSKDTLWPFIRRFKSVVIKPTSSFGGNGVIQIEEINKGQYNIHYKNKKTTVTGKKKTYKHLRSITKGRKYLVQQKIHLASIKGKPFDLRVMVQRGKQKKWVVTGYLAKVAGDGYFITNLEQGGKAIPVAQAISRSNLRDTPSRSLINNIKNLSLQAAKKLSTRYAIKEVGMDIGIDRKGKAWIIEGNFKPDHTMFRKLKNKAMYRTIRKHR